MDKIIITDLVTSGIIGIKKPERDTPQEILVNCTFYTDTSAAGQSDSISKTINYSTAAKTIIALVAESQFYTVEGLAEYLSSQLLKIFSPNAIRIRVEKTQVVKAARRVGVEIFRRNN